MITTVFIDIDNTLLDFRKCSTQSLRQGFADFGLVWTEDFLTTFHAINNGLWRQLETGEIPSRQALFEVRFDRVFAAAGIQCDGRAFEKRFQQLLDESHEPVDGALDLLQYLAEKYTVCAASNSGYEHQYVRLQDAGMLPYIKHVFVSEEAGASKPDAAFFRWCMERLEGVRPEEIVMIGDSLTADVAGSQNFGIRCVWFNYNQETAPAEIAPWKTADALSDIRGIL